MTNLCNRPPYQKEGAEQRKLDKLFREWIREQRSCISGGFSEEVNGKKLNPACHVRRVSRGAGTGTKPLFSCVPMTHEEHKIQTDHGETAVLPEEMLNASPCHTAEEWFEWMADSYYQRWLQLDR